MMAALLVGTTMAFAEAGTYCNYYGESTMLDAKYCAITFETASNGDVVMTISDGPGYTNCSYRNGGFEGGIEKFFVNEEPAADYFSYDRPVDGATVARLVLNDGANVPAGASIIYKEAALSWKCNEDANRYHLGAQFEYAYGSAACGNLDAPKNVAIDADSILTFDAVEGADHYQVLISYKGNTKLQQIIASGDKLVYEPMETGTYNVQVRACGYDILDSEWSAAINWNLTAEEIVLGDSEYCEELFLEGDNRAATFTWETTAEGSVVITIEDATDAEEKDGAFRGNGISIDKFHVGALPASTYFDHSVSPDKTQVILTLKDKENAPVKGEKITVDAIIEYKTALDGNAWPTLKFEYTYGTVCPGTITTIVDAWDKEIRSKKVVRNGQLIIVRDGVEYNAMGAQL